MKAVVFDWDLTLWNSWDIHVWLMHQTADALGAPRPERSSIARRFSVPFLQHLALFFGGDQARVVDTYVGFYRDTVTRTARLYPGVEETLQALKAHGYRLGVFSDKRRSFGEAELELTGIGPLLGRTLFLADGRPQKPDPSGLLEVMAGLGVSPDETLFVGDGCQDVECAHRAGAMSGAALWGTVDRDDVLACRPHYRWERPEGILDTLGIGAR